jgi:hypothetical protein
MDVASPNVSDPMAYFRFFGAGDGIRTRDIDLGKVALYQLSYSRTPWASPFSPAICRLVKLTCTLFILNDL